MKTKLFFLIVLIGITMSVNAQRENEKSFKIGVGALTGLPMGDINDFTNLAVGFDMLGEFAVGPSFALTLSVGYVDFFKKSGIDQYSDTWGLIPLLVGAKYFFSDRLYVSAQGGISFASNGSGGQVSFAPGIGIKLSEKFDLLIKYQSASQINASYFNRSSFTSALIGLRAGYRF